jgi:uncharacterized delta-60 repeat protein
VTLALSGAAGAVAGDLDPSFGVGGVATTTFPGLDGGTYMALLVQPDGKVIAAGSGDQGGFQVATLVRYNADGSLDTGFGSGGRVVFTFNGVGGAFYTLALQSDGKIVAAGISAATDFGVARFNPDGSPDLAFGTNGSVSTDLGDQDVILGLSLQPDGKILAGGRVGFFNPRFGLVRYSDNGSLDPSFGVGGAVVSPFNGSLIIATTFQPDGKVLAGGSSPNVLDFALARYNADGTPDTTFADNGEAITDFALSDVIQGLALQADGGIVASGGAVLPIAGGASTDVFALARYRPDGTLDQTFGAGGKVTTDFPPTDSGEDLAGPVAIQPDGKIVAGGCSGNCTSFGVARYESDGSADLGFGSAGLASKASLGPVQALTLQADGKILVAVNGLGVARLLGKTVVTAVSVDIKPGSDTNPINLSSRGVIPVAILTTKTFDATTVDPLTVCFGDADDRSQRDCTAVPTMGEVTDVNRDRRADLLLGYEVNQTGIDPGDTTACLAGRTRTGASIEGCDVIRTQ